jgi:flagellar basal-body rod protein FlgC
MLSALDINASGLKAQRIRLDTISQNVASAGVTRDAAGRPNPYQRRFVVFTPGDGNGGAGVHVESIRQDQTPFPLKLDIGHPDADAEGYVKQSNVDLSKEFVNAIEATRAYEANITMMETTKSMFNASLRLIA